MQPTRVIPGAHIPSHGPPESRVKRRRVRALPQGSVTSVLYLHDGYTLVSSGSADGLVKFWDTRKNPTPVDATPSEFGSWMYILGKGASSAQAKKMAALMRPEDFEKIMPAYEEARKNRKN